MSEWPSGLRRQTQEHTLASQSGVNREFWSSFEGRGSNPLSDKHFYPLTFPIAIVKMKLLHANNKPCITTHTITIHTTFIKTTTAGDIAQW